MDTEHELLFRQNRTFWIFDPRSTIHDPRPLCISLFKLLFFIPPSSEWILGHIKCLGFGRSTPRIPSLPSSFLGHFFARTIASGGPPGGLPAASADPRHTPALAARLAQARKKIGAPSLACGAHLLAEGSLCGRAIVECLLSLAWPLLLGPLASFFFLSFLNPPSKNDDNGPYDRDEGIAQGR